MTKAITKIDLHVAKRLRAARLQRGVSQESAGQAIGVSFQQMQKYEKGTNRITAAKLFQLATLYDLPIQWFFDDAESPARNRNARPSRPA